MVDEKVETLKRQFVPDAITLINKGYKVVYETDDQIVLSKTKRSDWLLAFTILGLFFWLIPGIIFGILWAFHTHDDVRYINK